MRVLRHLAAAAGQELAERLRDYPGFIARRLVTQADAEADVQAWEAIARWCAGERPRWSIEVDAGTLARWEPGRPEDAPPPSAWAVMAMAAGKALRHLDKLRAAKPDDGPLAHRRAAVAAILAGLENARDFHDGLNAELRGGAAATRHEAA